jgi:hypothetical protein
LVYLDNEKIKKKNAKVVKSKLKIRIRNKRSDGCLSSQRKMSVDSDNMDVDPRFKTILNDVLRYGTDKNGKFVNYKFMPDQPKPNIYLRKYSPEKIRIHENIKNHMNSYLSREPYDKNGGNLKSKQFKEPLQSLDIGKTASFRDLKGNLKI